MAGQLTPVRAATQSQTVSLSLYCLHAELSWLGGCTLFPGTAGRYDIRHNNIERENPSYQLLMVLPRALQESACTSTDIGHTFAFQIPTLGAVHTRVNNS